jgi:hypothetical protein
MNKLKLTGKAQAVFLMLNVMATYREYRPSPDYWYRYTLEQVN